jgi:hypothetical protein
MVTWVVIDIQLFVLYEFLNMSKLFIGTENFLVN